MAASRRRLALFALLSASLPHCAPAGDALDRPNVLFIVVDDLRPELGCYGVGEIKTPQIDRLAASGLRFTRAYCQQSHCNPSRASLLTGLRPNSTRVWDGFAHFRDAVPEVVTLPEHFKRNGYHAVAFGKVFHVPDPQSWNEPTRWPEKATTWSEASRRRWLAYREQLRARGNREAVVARIRPPTTDDEDVPDSQRPDGELADLAIAAMLRLAGEDRPFFLAVGFLRPHLPFTPPRKYWDLYRRDELPLASNPQLPEDSPSMAMNALYELREHMDFVGTPAPSEGSLTEAQRRRLKHGYYASVSFVDAQVGRVLDALEQNGLSDNTIVLLWGDHGWKLGEHNGWCKQTNYEVDTRVPLIVRAPGARANGKTSDALVELLDVYPTLSALASLPLPKHLEGESFLPLLDEPDQPGKAAAFSQFRRHQAGRGFMGYAIRTARHRYEEWIDRRSGETVARELYDHQVDPEENKNLANAPEQQPVLGELSRQLWASLPRPDPIEPTPE